MPRFGAPFQINIGANTRGLRRGLGRAASDLRRFNTDIERIGLTGAQKLRQYVNRHAGQVVRGVEVAVGTAAAADAAAGCGRAAGQRTAGAAQRAGGDASGRPGPTGPTGRTFGEHAERAGAGRPHHPHRHQRR